MKSFAFAVAAAVAVLVVSACSGPAAAGPHAGAADAQAAETPTVFTAVDGFRDDLDASGFFITGVVKGEAVPREVFVPAVYMGIWAVEYHRACEQLLVLMMERPGKYLLSVRSKGMGAFPACFIARAAP